MSKSPYHNLRVMANLLKSINEKLEYLVEQKRETRGPCPFPCGGPNWTDAEALYYWTVEWPSEANCSKLLADVPSPSRGGPVFDEGGTTFEEQVARWARKKYGEQSDE